MRKREENRKGGEGERVGRKWVEEKTEITQKRRKRRGG